MSKTLLDQIKKSATKKSQKEVKQTNPIWLANTILNKEDVSVVEETISLALITKELGSPFAEAKKLVNTLLFDSYVDLWWKTREIPRNPRLVVQHDNKDDSSLLFVVKLQTGLSSLLDLGEDSDPKQEFHKLLVETGINPKKGALLISRDLIVEERVEFTNSLDVLYQQEETKLATQKLLAYLTKGKAKPLTDSERGLLLIKKRIVYLACDFFDHILDYCTKKEELKTLLLVTKPIFQLSSFEFAIGDTPTNRVQRLREIASRYLIEDKD
jgi:hypothetical protein